MISPTDSNQKPPMDALQRELERKRAELASARAAAGGGAKVYVRRGDAAKFASSSTATLPTSSGALVTGVGSATSGVADSEKRGNDSSDLKVSEGAAAPIQLDDPEVRRRLRRYGQVVRFFGESAAAAAARLHTYELEHVMVREETALPGGFDAGSAVLGKRRQERIAEAVALGFGAKSLGLPALCDVFPGAGHAADEGASAVAPAAKRRRPAEGDNALDASNVLGLSSGSAAAATAADNDGFAGAVSTSGSAPASTGRSRAGSKDASGDEAAHSSGSARPAHEAAGGAGGASAAGTSASASAHEAEHVPAAGAAAAEARTVSAAALPHAADAFKYRPRPGNSSSDAHKYCYRFIKGLLAEWERDLAARPAAEAASPRGREEFGLWQQSRDYVKPLLRKLKERSLADDILTLVTELLGHCEDREYARAGDAYVRLAIGNAAWPIGVTAVGLHERAAREKVYEGRQAHVMHNEESRKYVTILKRLISYCQRKVPAEPSKSVYY